MAAFYTRGGLTLTKERKIIALVYEYQLSSAEIARKLRTTRQSVNQCKKRAELKLRAYYEK